MAARGSIFTHREVAKPLSSQIGEDGGHAASSRKYLAVGQMMDVMRQLLTLPARSLRLLADVWVVGPPTQTVIVTWILRVDCANPATLLAISSCAPGL